MNTKKLGRIVRPSHRVTGDPQDSVPGARWEFAHVAIDDHSRAGFVQVHSDGRKGSAYRSQLFNKTCHVLGIKHTFTRPYRPKTNGKAKG